MLKGFGLAYVYARGAPGTVLPEAPDSAPQAAGAAAVLRRDHLQPESHVETMATVVSLWLDMLGQGLSFMHSV